MGKRHTALLVEDDLETASDLGEIIRSLGHDCLHSPSQEEAQAIVEGGAEICYALLDLQINVNAASAEPKVEAGHNLIAWLRQRYPRRNADDHHHLQLLVMSGHAKDAPSVVDALALGGDDFSVKPFSENKVPLNQKIRNALQRSGRDDHRHCAKLNRDARSAVAAKGRAAGKRTTADSSQSPSRAAASATATPSDGVADSLDEVRPEPFCYVVQTGEREHRVETEEEYEALVGTSSSVHLYVNLIMAGKDRSRQAGFKDRKGKFKRVLLPTVQAIAVAEVICASSGLREQDFWVDTTRGKKAFLEARPKLDFRLAGGRWRSFKTIAGDTPRDTVYVLQPEEGVRYLLLHNLPQERLKRSGG